MRSLVKSYKNMITYDFNKHIFATCLAYMFWRLQNESDKKRYLSWNPNLKFKVDFDKVLNIKILVRGK